MAGATFLMAVSKDLNRIFPTAAFADDIQSFIHHIGRRAFLAAVKHVMDHGLDRDTVIADVRKNLTLFWLCYVAYFYSINSNLLGSRFFWTLWHHTLTDSVSGC